MNRDREDKNTRTPYVLSKENLSGNDIPVRDLLDKLPGLKNGGHDDSEEDGRIVIECKNYRRNEQYS